MGKDVFNMPELTVAALAAAEEEEEEDADYCTMRTTVSSSRPSSRSEDMTVDSTVLQSGIAE